MAWEPLPRDFLETGEGLMFAVVAPGLEQGRALCWLRYRRAGRVWCKLDSGAAQALLAERYPHYLYASPSRDVRVHGVLRDQVTIHHQPRRRLAQLLAEGPGDAVEARLCRLLAVLAEAGVDLGEVGVTGSLLIGAQRPDSDFDLVVYRREAFFQARRAIAGLLQAGRLQPLSEALWRESYERRACALSYADYVHHEQRKYNKAAFEGSKFDLTLTLADSEPSQTWHKRGHAVITARVRDAAQAFDHPARYRLEHPEIREALSYTHTYTGQAETGETVEIAGQVEQSGDGTRRIVVGSTGREAAGEYIRVHCAH